MNSRARAIAICLVMLALGASWSYPAVAVAQGDREAPSAIDVYLDGRPGSVGFPEELPQVLRERALAGEFVTREGGRTVVVMPLDDPPQHFAQVVLRDADAKSYTNKVDELPALPGIVRTSAMDIPVYGVSVLTFTSNADPKYVVGAYRTALESLHWRYLNGPTEPGRGALARFVLRGSTIELRVHPQPEGSIGTLWLNYQKAR